MKSIVLIVLTAVSTAAQAHPGHGEILHAHPELWALAVVVATLAVYFKKEVASK